MMPRTVVSVVWTTILVSGWLVSAFTVVRPPPCILSPSQWHHQFQYSPDMPPQRRQFTHQRSSRSRISCRRPGQPDSEGNTTSPLFQQRQPQSNDASSSQQRKRRRSLRKAVTSLVWAASTVGLWSARPHDALAAAAAGGASSSPLPPQSAAEKSTLSIRPGMSQNQVQALEQGDRSVLQELQEQSQSSQSSSSSVFTKQPTSSSNQQPSSSSLYGEDDEDDDFFLDGGAAAAGAAESSNRLSASFTSSSTATATLADKTAADRLQSSTKDSFAAYQKGKSKRLYVQVGAAFFVPTYGFLVVREYVRRRREERYVQKGLEILAAQKAEYFNITSTSSSNDADVQDALKNLKNKNATSSDDDDDDDDDDSSDDDDDESPSQRRGRPPRKPLGDPPSGSGGSSSGNGGGGGTSGNGGNDKPSAADIDKLNKIMGKS